MLCSWKACSGKASTICSTTEAQTPTLAWRKLRLYRERIVISRSRRYRYFSVNQPNVQSRIMSFQALSFQVRSFRIMSLSHGCFIQAWAFLSLVGICYGQQSKPSHSAPVKPIANFTDIAEKAGLTMQEIFGGVETKKYIIETTGTGVA